MTTRSSCNSYFIALTLALLTSTARAGDAPKLSDMGFLAGCWASKDSQRQIRECYTTPKAGIMQGSGQLIENGKTAFYEFILLSEDNGIVIYTPFPNGKKGPAFPLISFEGGHAVFENMTHDFPKRIIYGKNADGTVTARIEGATPESPGSKQWVMHPQGP